MKNFKLILAAAIMFVVGNAFTQAPQEKVEANWYIPLDPQLESDDPAAMDFDSYDPASAQEEPDCPNTEVRVCAAQFLDPDAPANQIDTKD